MTVSSQTSNETFHGNGVTVVWDLPFRFFNNADVSAYRIDPITQETTLLAQGTDYTLTGAGLPEQFGAAPGKITTTVPMAGGKDLYVERIMDVEQLTDIVNQGRFFPEVHEDVFDRLTMLIQQQVSGLGRALVRPIGKDYYDAENRNISNLKDPVLDQDAVNNRAMQQYVGSVINSGTGPINLAQNVIYVDPYGVPKVVQDMSGDQGGKLNGYKAPGTNTVKRDIYEKIRREIELSDYLTGGADNTVQFQNMLADIPNKTTSRMISFAGMNASYSGTTPRVIVRAGDYSISSALTLPSYLDLIGEESIITQTNAANDLFTGSAYLWSIEGFVLVGGRYLIDFYNANINSTMVDLRHLDLMLSSAFAINSRATGGVFTHLSCEANIYKTRILACRQAINNACDSMTVKNSWIQPSKVNMTASTAVIVNKGASGTDPNTFTRLKIQDTFLIPDIGVEGVDRINNARWVDNYGSFEADHARFGGEDGGMPIVWQLGAPNTAFPWNTTEVVLKNSTLFCGPDSRIDSCVLGIQGQVPNTFIVDGCVGPVGKPLIANLSSTNLPTYFANFQTASGKKAYEYFKVKVDVDTHDINAYTPIRPIMPDDMYPYLVKGRSTKIRKQTQTITNAFAANLVSFSTVISDNVGAFAIANPTRLVMPGGCSKMTINAMVVMAVDAAAKVISVDVVDSGGVFVEGSTMLYGINPDNDRIKINVTVSGAPGSYWSLRIRHLAAASLNLVDCQVTLTPTDQIV